MLDAYVFQIYICIFSWAYVHLFNPSSPKASQPYMKNLITLQEPLSKGRRSCTEPLEKFSKIRGKLVRYIDMKRRRLSNSHFSRALVSSLVDFQKAQVLLMVAIQSSSLWAMYRQTFLMELSSIQQITNTIFFLKIVSWMGVFPVASTLYTLFKANQGSRYVTLLSLGSVVVSFGLSIKLNKFGDTIYDIVPNGANPVDGLPACGGLRSPLYYCDTGKGDLDIALGEYTDRVISGIWGLYYAIFSLAIIGSIANCVPSISWVTAFLRRARNGGFMRIVRVLSVFMQLSTVAVIGFLLKSLLNLSGVRSKTSNTNPAGTNLIDTSWTLGQIIAFLTWVPFVIGFIHLLLCESKEGQL